MSNITAVTDASFDKEVLQSSIPVLVDFWAEWCGPCRMIAPLLEELEREYTGKVKFVKMNVDENPQIPVKYSVRGIPTLILFKNGSVEGTRVGAHPKLEIAALLDTVV